MKKLPPKIDTLAIVAINLPEPSILSDFWHSKLLSLRCATTLWKSNWTFTIIDQIKNIKNVRDRKGPPKIFFIAYLQVYKFHYISWTISFYDAGHHCTMICFINSQIIFGRYMTWNKELIIQNDFILAWNTPNKGWGCIACKCVVDQIARQSYIVSRDLTIISVPRQDQCDVQVQPISSPSQVQVRMALHRVKSSPRPLS